MTNARKNSVKKTTEVYDDGFLRVEHKRFFVACDGTAIKLPRVEFLILSRLAQTPNRIVTAIELWQRAQGDGKELNRISLHVYMYRLRKRFEPFNIRIETMINVGYRLVPNSRASGVE